MWQNERFTFPKLIVQSWIRFCFFSSRYPSTWMKSREIRIHDMLLSLLICEDCDPSCVHSGGDSVPFEHPKMQQSDARSEWPCSLIKVQTSLIFFTPTQIVHGVPIRYGDQKIDAKRAPWSINTFSRKSTETTKWQKSSYPMCTVQPKSRWVAHMDRLSAARE